MRTATSTIKASFYFSPSSMLKVKRNIIIIFLISALLHFVFLKKIITITIIATAMLLFLYRFMLRCLLNLWEEFTFIF